MRIDGYDSFVNMMTGRLRNVIENNKFLSVFAYVWRIHVVWVENVAYKSAVQTLEPSCKSSDFAGGK